MSRQRPTRSDVTLEDITLIVRPPGKPMAIRSFTDAQRAEAETYAADNGAVVEPLPLPYPQSYRGPAR